MLKAANQLWIKVIAVNCEYLFIVQEPVQVAEFLSEKIGDPVNQKVLQKQAKQLEAMLGVLSQPMVFEDVLGLPVQSH